MTAQLIMTEQGMIPREEFFNPLNLERIMADAQKRSTALDRAH